MARVQRRVPGNFEVPAKFFGRFTWKDILRLTLPTLPVLTLTNNTNTAATIGLLLLSTATGIIWYLFQPYQQYVDELLYNAVRWAANRESVDGTSIAETHEDHIETRDGALLSIIEISPTNLQMKTEAEQAALLNTYQNLFKTISYPIQIHSKQEELDLHQYLENIQGNETPDGQLHQDYLEYIQEFTGKQHTTTHHYITTRVNRETQHLLQKHLPFLKQQPAEEKQVLKEELDSRTREITTAIDSPELTATRLTEQKLQNTAAKINSTQPNTTPLYTSQKDGFPGEYRRTLHIKEFPSTLEAGWPQQLLQTHGLTDITQTIQPQNPAKTSKKLQQLSEKLNAEINSFLQQGYHGTNKLEGILDDVEWFLDLLADRKDHPVQYSALITAHNPSQKQCDQTFQQVQNRLDTMQTEYRQPVLRTDKAHLSENPLHTDHLSETLLMPASSAATGFPFTTQNPEKNNGVIHGTDTQNQTPVLIDRYSWSSHSMARMGMVGSGKSYAAKIELLRSRLAYPNLQIIIVDPKQEYQHITEILDGRQHLLNRNSYTFQAYDTVNISVEERGQEENKERLVDLLQQIYSYTSQNQRKTLVLIDEARTLLNHETGRQTLNQFVLEARDTNTGITLITQNASHFTHSREGREILDNMPGKIFMRHDRVPDSVTQYFNLSQQEKQKLYELKTGTDSQYSEALLKVNGKIDTKIQIQATPREKQLLQGEDGQ